MDELLASWDVSQETIEVFSSNNIDITCLDALEDEELKILIPDYRLRDRIKFKMGLKNYKMEIKTVHSNTDSLDTDSLSSCDLFHDESEYTNRDFNLQEILKNSMQGRQALQAMKNQKLDSSSRSCLVKAIVEYYIKTYKKMTTANFMAISAEIVLKCPNECKETYYIPSRTLGSKNTMPAKGKLVDRYYNQLRTLRASGVLAKKRKTSFQSDNDTTENDKNDDTEHEHDEKKKWLRYNRDPWPLVEEKWKATCAYRKKNTYDCDEKLPILLNTWPCLKASNGHRLIDIDFSHLYPDKNLMLFEKWDTFKKRAIVLMQAEAIVGDKYGQQFLEENDNVRDFAVCSSLAYIIKPTSKIMNAEKKRYNKVSIAESTQAFMTHVQNYADIEEELQNRHKSYNKKGLTCQPLIISVGSPAALDAFYAAVDDIKYRFDSLMKALDVCFKCFMVLNLAYPKECEQLWLFIQQYFYEIQLPSDKKFCQVTSFIKKL